MSDDDNVVYMWGKDIAENAGGSTFAFNDTVNIPRGEYEELLADSMFLGALVITGVVNWSGYPEAERLFDAWNENIETEQVEVANDS